MPGTPVVLVGMKKDLRQSVAATNSLVPEDTPGQVAKTIGENPFHHLMIAIIAISLCPNQHSLSRASVIIYFTDFRSHCLL